MAFVGTAATIADEMEAWLHAEARDGFSVMFPCRPEGFDAFVDPVVLELQRRGLRRTRNGGATLREHLELPRPANRFFDRRHVWSNCSDGLAAGDRMSRKIEIAIVGAGFSGSLLALQILRIGPDVRVYLIEKAEQFGRGLAYGAADAGHLLNVRAANMSAFPEETDHFVDWLRATMPNGQEAPAFVSRQLYGSYLQALLNAIAQSDRGAGRLVAIGDEVVGASFEGSRPRLRLAMGRDLHADVIVLATGNLPPRDLSCFADADPAVYVSDPWSANAFETQAPDDDVLLVGTGLTAVDMILRLRSLGHTGTVQAISRRGLRPHRHLNLTPPMTPLAVPTRPTPSALLRHVRVEAEARGWREAVDGLRPCVQRLWCEASASERRRFLRHLRPWWDVHRHRVAPSVAAVIDDLEARGRLTFAAGRIEDVRFDAGRAAVLWAPRGSPARRVTHVDRIVNCTGPAGNLGHARMPLLQDLLRRGLARPDAYGLGLDVDAACHVIDIDGQPQERLLAVGPMSRGAFWEITAVPDIRVQTARIAAHLYDVEQHASGTKRNPPSAESGL